MGTELTVLSDANRRDRNARHTGRHCVANPHFWRNVYTPNYEVLLLPDGKIPDFTEPSVTVWVPPPPVV